MKYEILIFKVVVVGDGGVGKSSLIQRFCKVHIKIIHMILIYNTYKIIHKILIYNTYKVIHMILINNT